MQNILFERMGSREIHNILNVWDSEYLILNIWGLEYLNLTVWYSEYLILNYMMWYIC